MEVVNSRGCYLERDVTKKKRCIEEKKNKLKLHTVFLIFCTVQIM